MADNDNLTESSPFLNEDRLRAMEALMAKMTKHSDEMASSLERVARAADSYQRNMEKAEKSSREEAENANKRAKASEKEVELQATRIAQMKAQRDREGNTLGQNVVMDQKMLQESSSRKAALERQASSYAEQAEKEADIKKRQELRDKATDATNKAYIEGLRKEEIERQLEQDKKQQTEAIKKKYGVQDAPTEKGYGVDYQKQRAKDAQSNIDASVAKLAELESRDRAGLSDEEKERLDKQIKKQEEAIELNKQQLESSKKQLAQLEYINQGNELVQKAAQEVAKYQATFNTRLQGTEKTFDSISTLLRDQLTVSPFVTIPDMLKQIKAMTDQGIAYNLEQRAFLGQISDRMADTFDALDQSLTRLIRLQQADTTSYRLALEATLTKFLNSMFTDTSYLSGVSDAVSAAILDANAQLTRDQSLSFEASVQKWLGSLYSLGASQNVITQIATGLNWLGTGDVKSLSGNTAMQTMLAMSASRAGLNYGTLLTEGLTAEDTNKLLRSMVEYLKEIADNSSNQVVKKAFSDVLGITISDLRAAQSLTSQDIETIYGTSVTAGYLEAELDRQKWNVVSRTPVSQLIDNLFDNINYTRGANIAQNPVFYGTWRAIDYLRNSLGGGKELGDIQIPGISIFGNMVDLHTGIFQLMQAGMMGLSDLVTLWSALKSLGNLGGLSLNDSQWNASRYTPRGTGYTGILAGTAVGISQSGTIRMSGSAGDIEASTLAGGSESAQQQNQYVGKEFQEEQGSPIDPFMEAAVDKELGHVRVYDDTIFTLLSEQGIRAVVVSAADPEKDIASAIHDLIQKITVDKEGNVGVNVKSLPSLKNDIEEAMTSYYRKNLSVSMQGSGSSASAEEDGAEKENYVKNIWERLDDMTSGGEVRVTVGGFDMFPDGRP